MKLKYKTLFLLTLTAVLLLSSCGLQQTASAASERSPASLPTADGGSDGQTAALLSSVSGGELFTERDLSGEYDAADAVFITLNGSTAAADSDTVRISGSAVTITAAGTYIISGTLDNGSVIVAADKEDKVQLVLNAVSINSDTFAAIYISQADKVFVTLADGTVNRLSNGGSFIQIDDNEVDAVVFSKDDITFNGTGTLQISSPAGHGIVGKDEVTITGGVYEIAAAKHAVRANDSIAVSGGSFALAGEDGLHAENSDDDSLGSIVITGGDFTIKVADDAIHAVSLLQIDGGTYSITAAEGLEGTYIRINDGTIHISASDDGVNAAHKSSAYTPTVEINGGSLTIVMGAGDTDGVDSNGNIIINGGTVSVTGGSSFDCDGTAQYNGGTIIVNGQQVDSIPNQMMGGMRGGFGGGSRGGRGWH